MNPDLPPFRPRFPWWGRDLQTIANRLRGVSRSLAPHASERLAFALPDGTGDMLLASLDRPATPKQGTPLVILIHGLTGAEDSLYILSMARLMLDRGWRVLRLNLRGAGPSRSLWKYLGEEGAAAPLAAAATVSAPIDLAATCRYMMRRRNKAYHRYILGLMKVEATAEGAVVSAAERAAIMGARSIWDYDDAFIAPRYGFGRAEDYYDRCRPTRFMAGIRVPTLAVAALDDPWIPGALYRSYDWTSNRSLAPLLPERGGHVGFHGTVSRQPWSDLAVARFFDHG